MALDLTVNRPKLAQTVTVEADLTVGTAVENDAEGSVFIPILNATIDPASFTVSSVSTTSASTTITSTSGFGSVRVGDSVSGTGIAGGSTVATKTSDSSLELSQAATATGTITATFDPPSVVTPALAAIKVTFTSSGATLVPSFTFYKYDGSLGATIPTDSNATSSVSLTPSSSSAIDYDSFLTTLRSFRTNA